MYVGWKCDKYEADTQSKSMTCSSDHVVNCSGNTMEETLGLGVICVDDETCNCDQTHNASVNNFHFQKVKAATEEDDDEDLGNRTESLVCASIDTHKDAESPMQ